MPGALATALATQTVKAQVEASVGIHLHVCHVLLAEALHKVYDEPFQVSSEVVQTDLLDPSTSTFFVDRVAERRASTSTIRRSSRVAAGPRAVGSEPVSSTDTNTNTDAVPGVGGGRRRVTVDLRGRNGDPAAVDYASHGNNDNGETNDSTANRHVTPIFEKFRKVHMNLASDGVAGMASLISASVPILAEQIERHPDLTELTHDRSDLTRTLDPARKPSKSALSRRSSSKRSSAVDGGSSSKTPATSQVSSAPAAEVSFNPAGLVAVEIENTHPVTQAFTQEMFKYEAFFGQQLTAVAELQRQIMSAILAQMREANKYVESEEDRSADRRRLPNYNRIVAASIQRNVEQQENFMDCFFASLGVVRFPNLDPVRSEISFPSPPTSNKHRSPNAVGYSASPGGARAGHGHQPAAAASVSGRDSEDGLPRERVGVSTLGYDQYGVPLLATEIPIHTTAEIVTREKPHMELVLYGFTEFWLRNRDKFVQNLFAKLPAAKNLSPHPKLRMCSVFRKRLKHATLGKAYFDRFYRNAMTKYATQLMNLVTRYVAIRAELERRKIEFPSLVSSSRDETMRSLAVMASPPRQRLTVIPAETDNEDLTTTTPHTSDGEDELNGRTDTAASRAAERRRFMALRSRESSHSRDADDESV